LHPPEHPPTVTLVAWPQAFTGEELDRIERTGDALPLAQAGLFGGQNLEARDKVRVTRTAGLDSNVENIWIYDRIQKLAMAINAMSYHFELTDFSEGIRYSVYHGAEGDHYDWHVDQGRLATPPEALAVAAAHRSVNL
jgi:hypothetical protein